MTASEVTALLEEEIAGRWAESNHHGVDLRRSLLSPIRTRFIDRIVREGALCDSIINAWLVLEECPDTCDGYKIVYDEQRDSFALASAGFESDAHPVIAGWYGDFWTTFKGM